MPYMPVWGIGMSGMNGMTRHGQTLPGSQIRGGEDRKFLLQAGSGGLVPTMVVELVLQNSHLSNDQFTLVV